MDKHIILAHKNGVALLEREHEYIVVTGYNPDGVENQQWDSGTYFSHWGRQEKKAEYLMCALDLFRSKTEEAYISVQRMEELANLFKDGLIADDRESAMEYFAETCEMEVQEKKFFGIEEQKEEKQIVAWQRRSGR